MVHTFRKGISPKVKVITRLEFGLTGCMYVCMYIMYDFKNLSLDWQKATIM